MRILKSCRRAYRPRRHRSTVMATIRRQRRQGATSRLPIAIPPSAGAAGRFPRLREVILCDLARRRCFGRSTPPHFRNRSADVNVQGRRSTNGKAISAHALLTGQAVSDSDGARLHVYFRLCMSTAGEQLLGLPSPSTQDNWRRVAHKVVGRPVYEKLTGGARLIFYTLVSFGAEIGSKAHPFASEIIDAERRPIPASQSHTDGSVLALPPRFSANSQEVTYIAAAAISGLDVLICSTTSRPAARRRSTLPGQVFAPRLLLARMAARVSFSWRKDGQQRTSTK